MRYYVAQVPGQTARHDVLSHIVRALGRKNFLYISYGTLGSLILYLLFPSISSVVAKIFGKRISSGTVRRIDRYTTGLTNVGNYCFANSSIQGLCSLDNLTRYLDEVYRTFQNNKELSVQTDSRMVIHEALTDLLADLQEPIFSPRSKNIAPLVKALEIAYGGRMSSNQNDAHEFLQLMVEALQSEYFTLKMAVPGLVFPFDGKMASSFVCLSCGRTSTIAINPFLVYELVTPQCPSASVSEIISKSQSELIEGYSCLYCKVSLILQNESRLSSLGVSKDYSKEERETLKYLYEHHDKLLINEDIPSSLEYYINSYNKNGCQPTMVKSNVARKVVVTKPPQVLVIHLSRSNYNGMNYSRNPCNVDFQEILDLQVQDVRNNTWNGVGIVKYALRSIVKHTGSHYQGHYQCYRKKPNFVVDTSSDPPNFANRSITLQKYEQGPSMDLGQIASPVKLKKTKNIKSVVRRPYWHISDTSVKEASANNVLGEKKYVYLLFYDRIDP